MEAKFKGIKDDPNFRGWTLPGNNILINKGNGHSCSSLAYAVLLAGDIYSLLSRGYSASFSSITTPGMLCVALATAKKAELVKYPDTKKFSLFESREQREYYNNL